MSANPKFIAATAQVDEAAVQALPKSRKVYLQGSRADILVPMREITLSDTPTATGMEKNPPLTVYDTSGPYTDPTVKIDIRSGLAPLRAGWIAERGDTEALTGPSSRFGVERLERSQARGTALRPSPQAAACQARAERHADALRAAGNHDARNGIHRDS